MESGTVRPLMSLPMITQDDLGTLLHLQPPSSVPTATTVDATTRRHRATRPPPRPPDHHHDHHVPHTSRLHRWRAPQSLVRGHYRVPMSRRAHRGPDLTVMEMSLVMPSANIFVSCSRREEMPRMSPAEKKMIDKK